MAEEKSSGLSFIEVIERLKLVLEIDSDRQLAPKIGIGYSTFTMRKTRNSLPKEAIDALIEREQLNPEFIYEGIGPVHIPLDGVPWRDQFQGKLRAVLSSSDEGWLVREGYKRVMLKAVASGKQPPSMELIRDLRKLLSCDLNALFCDEPAAATDTTELALLSAYRSATKEGKATIQQVAGMAAKKG